MRSVVLVLLLTLLGTTAGAQPVATPVAPPALYQATSAPDPTRLTTEQLFREIGTLEKSINAQLITIVKNADEFKRSLTGFPTEVDQKITQLEKLQNLLIRSIEVKFDEKIAGIALQFKERDERVLQLASGTKIAVDLALSAQKEQVVAQNLNIAASIAEIKTTFGKLIDNQQQIQLNSTKALEERISAVKDQVTAITGRSTGMGDSWVTFLGFGGFAIGAAGLIMAFSRGRLPPPSSQTPQVVYIPTPATLPTSPMPPQPSPRSA